MARLRTKIMISLLLPLLSVFIFAVAFNMQNSNATGLAVLTPRPLETLDATLSLTIASGEFIPIDSDISVRYDGALATLALGHILAQQAVPALVTVEENPKLNYAGKGIKGPYTLTFRLTDFLPAPAVSQSPIEVSLLYKTQVLSQSMSTLQKKA